MSRFFIFWLVITAFVFGWSYIMNTVERKLVSFWVKRGVISGVAAVVIMAIIFHLNNVSGL